MNTVPWLLRPPADGLCSHRLLRLLLGRSPGVTHYTDAPLPAERKEVDLRVSPLIGTPPLGPGGQLQQPDRCRCQESPGGSLEIDLISPEPGSTLRDNTGNIVFQGEISPQVPVQYDVRLILNGKAAPWFKTAWPYGWKTSIGGAYEARLELLAKRRYDPC